MSGACESAACASELSEPQLKEGSVSPSSSQAETVRVMEVFSPDPAHHKSGVRPVSMHPLDLRPPGDSTGPFVSTMSSACPETGSASSSQLLCDSMRPARVSSTERSDCSGQSTGGVQQVSCNASSLGIRTGSRPVFTGLVTTCVEGEKVSRPSVLREVTPISSRPVFTGPGSIPRRGEGYPARGESDPPVIQEVPDAEAVGNPLASLLPCGRPLPPRPPTPKRKRLEPERASCSSGSASSEEGLTPADAEAFLARLDARPTCSSGHPLFSFGPPEPGWWCSSCKRVFTTRRLLWGCRVCDFDVCGNCLVNLRSETTSAPSAAGATTPAPGDSGGVEAWPSVRLLRASGTLPRKDMFPDDLRLTLEVDGQELPVVGSCLAPELKGGFRKVFHLRGAWPSPNVVLKLAQSDADNINEVKCAAVCPAAFTHILGSGSIYGFRSVLVACAKRRMSSPSGQSR
ncbi:unnamed protein product [Symbiodinium natans]|uniref:Uncharacterized protein n=1 Tax=Symbiodinium natans TaxID=878477 RepID=A0A812IE00_9DINO|nr:unnamed protein product [Symbiodinium natans]